MVLLPAFDVPKTYMRDRRWRMMMDTRFAEAGKSHHALSRGLDDAAMARRRG